MATDSNTVWLEGMFITPQHFQQHDRYLHDHIKNWMGNLFGECSGLRNLEIDQGQLRAGSVRVMKVQGVFPDGTPFVSEREISLQVPEGTVKRKVYLALPLYRPGQVNVGRNAPMTMRYTSFSGDVIDESTSDNDLVSVEQSRLNFSLQLEGNDLSCYTLLPLLEVMEMHNDGAIVINSSFIPPCLDIAASPVLVGQLTELTAVMVQRSRQACQRLQAGVQSQSRQMRVLDLLWLQTLNRWMPWFNSYTAGSTLSTADLFRWLSMCLGDLLALMPEPLPDLPVFNHNAPGPGLQTLLRSLKRALSNLVDERVMVLSWNKDQFAQRRLMILEESGTERLANGRMVLGVHSNAGVSQVSQRFVNASKMCGKSRIETLLCSALPGIRLERLPVAPAELQSLPDMLYFEVDRSDPLWQELMRTEDQLTIHIDERLPDVDLTLYVIRTGDGL